VAPWRIYTGGVLQNEAASSWMALLTSGRPAKTLEYYWTLREVKWPSTRIILNIGIIWQDLREGTSNTSSFIAHHSQLLTAHGRGGIDIRSDPLGPKPETGKQRQLAPFGLSSARHPLCRANSIEYSRQVGLFLNRETNKSKVKAPRCR